jgi:hypothetical protein
MGEALKEVKSYALSDSDIKRILGRGTKITTYPQLANIDSIDQLFDKKGRGIIFCPNAAPNVGHWTCLIRRPDSIEYFDPYGDKPEGFKKGLGENRKEALDIEEPYLSRLLRASGKPVYYNTKAFQVDKADVATCGRHCVARLLYAPDSIDEYNNAVQSSGMNPDTFVSGLTYNALHK